MDHSHSLYPSFRGKDVWRKILGLINFRRQSSRNVFGTASRSTVHLCSRWHITQLSHMAIWQQIISLPLTCVTRVWLSLQATPTDTGMCCSFNLKSGLKDGKYKWGTALWLPPSSTFSPQTDPCSPSKLFSTHCFSGEFRQGALIWETFTGASSYDPPTWFWQGELVRID